MSDHYRPPTRAERVFNRVVSALMQVGGGPPAARQLEVRAYLLRWGSRLGRYFGGVDGKSSDAELLRIAPNHPIFLLERT